MTGAACSTKRSVTPAGAWDEGGEIVDGNESWLSDKEYPTMDAAIASVRGQRAANTRKANFDAKYGDIPNTLEGRGQKVAMALIDAGHEIDRFSNPRSQPEVHLLGQRVQVRLADHDLPGSTIKPTSISGTATTSRNLLPASRMNPCAELPTAPLNSAVPPDRKPRRSKTGLGIAW